jgi:hypothetical protein
MMTNQSNACLTEESMARLVRLSRARLRALDHMMSDHRHHMIRQSQMAIS